MQPSKKIRASGYLKKKDKPGQRVHVLIGTDGFDVECSEFISIEYFFLVFAGEKKLDYGERKFFFSKLKIFVCVCEEKKNYNILCRKRAPGVLSRYNDRPQKHLNGDENKIL